MSRATSQNGQLHRSASLQTCNTCCVNGGVRIHRNVRRFLLRVCTNFSSQNTNCCVNSGVRIHRNVRRFLLRVCTNFASQNTTCCINSGVRIHRNVRRFLLRVFTNFASQNTTVFSVHGSTCFETLFAADQSFHDTPWSRLSQCLPFNP